MICACVVQVTFWLSFTVTCLRRGGSVPAVVDDQVSLRVLGPSVNQRTGFLGVMLLVDSLRGAVDIACCSYP